MTRGAFLPIDVRKAERNVSSDVARTIFRAVRRAARDTGSAAVETDAWHHRADAITSAAAFIGISVALIGKPPNA